MPRKLWIGLTLFLVIPGLLLTLSCAKKTSTIPRGMDQMMEECVETQAVEAATVTESQKAMEEESLEAEAEKIAKAARKQFVNEDIRFDFDSSVLLRKAQEILKRKADWLRKNPGVKVSIEGHCDERGTNEYNLVLGDSRAQSAKTFLVDMGISASRFSTVSYGEERPIAPGHNEAAWEKNRRGHFVID